MNSQCGNFPQTNSHVDFINAAFAVERCVLIIRSDRPLEEKAEAAGSLIQKAGIPDVQHESETSEQADETEQGREPVTETISIEGVS
jgi:hypothetical protein